MDHCFDFCVKKGKWNYEVILSFLSSEARKPIFNEEKLSQKKISS